MLFDGFCLACFCTHHPLFYFLNERKFGKKAQIVI